MLLKSTFPVPPKKARIEESEEEKNTVIAQFCWGCAKFLFLCLKAICIFLILLKCKAPPACQFRNPLGCERCRGAVSDRIMHLIRSLVLEGMTFPCEFQLASVFAKRTWENKQDLCEGENTPMRNIVCWCFNIVWSLPQQKLL